MNRDTMLHILDLARWAPSGDNTQPWRCEIVADDQVLVHGHDTRDHVLYDFDGRPSHMAHGALLETMRIAASGFGLVMTWTVEADAEARKPVYRILFVAEPTIAADPLLAFIEKRTVQRRPMRTTPLTAAQRSELIVAAGENVSLQFFEGFSERLKVARLLWQSAHIRLTCPEAYPVHKEIIEWGARFSIDKIPEQAVGVDPLTAKLMRWALQSWKRVEFFNHYLFGTVLPRLQLDFMPALRCAAHLLIRPKRPPAGLQDWLELGMTMQRVWLTATRDGLHLQPEMTPIIFRWYAQGGVPASNRPSINQSIESLAGSFDRVADTDRNAPFAFFGRVGQSSIPRSRSLRQPLDALLVKPATGSKGTTTSD